MNIKNTSSSQHVISALSSSFQFASKAPKRLRSASEVLMETLL
ncbi:hypothetical protein QJS83_14490 [Bdellovibrio sp. 22V]|nr:hypothetical protein [Bdellovibrio sp. 22V]WII71674.1 hypothetical protein QJS83_14490 [Bdellovibrio sp. 22V]